MVDLYKMLLEPLGSCHLQTLSQTERKTEMEIIGSIIVGELVGIWILLLFIFDEIKKNER